jgi:uncharacterized protein
VRNHDPVARIEVPAADLQRLTEPAVRAALVRDLKRLGFRYVTLDLQGFRSGSLNEILPDASAPTPPNADPPVS